MTCIVYDGKAVAAEGRSVRGEGLITSNDSLKVCIIKDKIVAGSGDGYGCDSFMDWLRDLPGTTLTREIIQGDMGRKPFFASCDTTEILIVGIDGVAERYDHHCLRIVQAAPVVLGCGSAVALAALKCGRDARGAVEIVCELNSFCGGEITVITLEDLKAHLSVDQAEED